MINFFKKARDRDIIIEAPVARYVECRSWYGVTVHIRDTTLASGLTLCDYDPLDDCRELNLEVFQEARKHQHEGWRFCTACADSFLRLHE